MSALSAGCARALGVLAVVTAAIAGCATPAPEPIDVQAAWRGRLASLQDLDAWTAFGRIGVSVPGDSWSANVDWRQRGAAYRLRLSGPLGQGAVELEGEPGAVELRTAGGERLRARSPDALARRQLGWSLPVSGLRYWLLGQPDPGAVVSNLSLDPRGLPAVLEQSGWRIEYQRFIEVDGLAMPARLSLRSAPGGPAVEAKVLVRRWEMGT